MQADTREKERGNERGRSVERGEVGGCSLNTTKSEQLLTEGKMDN